MKIDLSPRAGGKTTRLIEWLRGDDKRIMITFSHEEENRLKRLYPELSNRILDWESYQKAYQPHMSKFEECGIDNVDIILRQRLHHPLSVISITDDNG